MSAFTRGPWRIAVPYLGFSAIHGADGALVFGLAAGSEKERQPEDVCDANARLIAAAGTAATAAEDMGYDGIAAVEALPELLEALKDLTLAYKALRKRAGYDGDDPSDSIDLAEAAIAKAGG